MDFSKIPDNVFLQILRYLPYKSCARIGRVNSRFYVLSTMVLSETKSIDLGDYIFNRLDSDQLAGLIGLCVDKLETVRVSRIIHHKKIEELAQFCCPRLTELDLGKTGIGIDTFGQLVENNPNLRALTWKNLYVPVIYPNKISQNLEYLKLCRCDEESLRSLTGKCSKLKHLEIETVFRSDGKIFDSFFEHCRNLEILIIRDVRFRGAILRFESMSHFWRLSALRILKLGNDYDRKMSDTDLEKISTRFQELEELELCQLNVSNWGVACLASLPKLKKLALSYNVSSVDISDGVRRLAENGQLEDARFDCGIAPIAFMSLIRLCPRLRFLYIHTIIDITSDDAVEILRSFGAIRNREIVVRMPTGFDVWKSSDLETMLKKLEDENGFSIRFENGYPNYLLPNFVSDIIRLC